MAPCVDSRLDLQHEYRRLQTLLKIRQIAFRLGISFGILLLVLIAVGWLGLHQMDRNNARLAEIQGKDWDRLRLAQEALRYSSINSRITLQLFLPQDEAQIHALQAARAENSRKIGNLLEKIEPLCDTPEETKLLADIKANRRPYVESYTRAPHLLLDEKNVAAATRQNL